MDIFRPINEEIRPQVIKPRKEREIIPSKTPINKFPRISALEERMAKVEADLAAMKKPIEKPAQTINVPKSVDKDWAIKFGFVFELIGMLEYNRIHAPKSRFQLLEVD